MVLLYWVTFLSSYSIQSLDLCMFIKSGLCASKVSHISSGGSYGWWLHHEWQPAAPEEEQEEVEAAVVPPQRQGALHLHSPWGEGAQSLPHQPQNSHTHSHYHSVTETLPHNLFFYPFSLIQKCLTLIFPLYCLSSRAPMKGLCALSDSALFFLKHKIHEILICILLLTARLMFFNLMCSLWFHQDKVASESLPLQGFTVKLTERPEGEESSNVFHLYHKKTLYYSFRADDQHTARRLEQESFIQIWPEICFGFFFLHWSWSVF